METIKSFQSKDTIPNEKAKNIEYLYTENGIKTSRLTAPILNRFAREQNIIELPKGFKIEMYDDLGAIKTVISGNFATRNESSKIIEAKYNVVVFDVIENKTLNTEHLIWDESNNKIHTNKFVKITTPEKIIFGDGFEANEDFSEYFILQPRGEILINRER